MPTQATDIVRSWTGLQGMTAKRIRSYQELGAFLESAERNPDAASLVGDLTVRLADPVAFGMLGQAIATLSNLSGLVLLLNSPVPEGFFMGLVLPSLVFLKTNIPHRNLLGFIAATPSLNTISLAACGRGVHEPCPLAAVSFQSVVTLEVPTTCVVDVAHGELLRLTMDGLHPALSVPAILQALPAPLTSLLYLTVDFLPNDYDILEKVIVAAPVLESLKLLEQAGTLRRQAHARRAWKDINTWHQCLLSLPNLRELALCTASDLVAVSADTEAERRLLHAWVAGVRRRSQQLQLPAHPVLSYIRLWYRRRADDNGVITHWTRDEGRWRNIVTIIGPPDDSVF